jgi:hypothetical protein
MYYVDFHNTCIILQGVSEIRVLILTGGGARQREQLFSLPFWRKTLRNGLKM